MRPHCSITASTPAVIDCRSSRSSLYGHGVAANLNDGGGRGIKIPGEGALIRASEGAGAHCYSVARPSELHGTHFPQAPARPRDEGHLSGRHAHPTDTQSKGTASVPWPIRAMNWPVLAGAQNSAVWNAWLPASWRGVTVTRSSAKTYQSSVTCESFWTSFTS